ncbi:MAG TPA: thrombospondin type 3 repeat-containing protein [Myxococcaceae bacterium]|nr:thrombospondin type 3 repeat-containing protein [Myxococcaceae bacterium]
MRWIRIWNVRAPLAAAAALCALAARAQSFPADKEWVPLRCGADVMTDPYRDRASALGERDLVGDLNAATGFRASDGEWLFLRIRVEQDPIPGGTPRPFAWGLLLDRDGDLSTYEVQILASGLDGTVQISQNTVTAQPNDPADPPDQPILRTYPMAKNARSLVAPGSSYGGNADYFLDFAVPWQDLGAVKLSPATPVTAWVATSSTSNVLDGDFACFDDAAGRPTLSGADPGKTTLDPRVDSDGDGYTDQVELRNGTDPHSASSHPGGAPDALIYAGGGGCSAAPGSPAMVGLALMLVAWALRGAATSAARSPGRSGAGDPAGRGRRGSARGCRAGRG